MYSTVLNLYCTVDKNMERHFFGNEIQNGGWSKGVIPYCRYLYVPVHPWDGARSSVQLAKYVTTVPVLYKYKDAHTLHKRFSLYA
jgi:hypothetical protein